MIYDIAIIGAGPGGYVAAIKASQLGLKVSLIEKENIGGVCLNRGCIPSKAVLASLDRYIEAKKLSKFGIGCEKINFDYEKISKRKNIIIEKLRKGVGLLLKNNEVDIFKGEAVIKSENKLMVNDELIEYKNLIVATGSSPRSLNNLEIDHDFILDTDDIINLEQLPENILIVGSGASGIEWARIFAGFGKKVVVTEIANRLAPMFDESQSERLERLFKKSRIKFYKETYVEKIEDKKVTLSNSEELNPDVIFLAAGRTPNSNIEGLKVELTKEGFIKVKENLETSIPNIYAIGDVNGLLPLAHIASHQGTEVVEKIANNKEVKINYNACPKIIYGHPEIASVGFTEEELRQKNIAYKVSNFPISAVGRSIIEDDIDGFIKLLATEEEILGAHIIASNADNLIQQCAIAINANLSPEIIKNTIFAHPTQSESVLEAFIGLDGKYMHLPN